MEEICCRSDSVDQRDPAEASHLTRTKETFSEPGQRVRFRKGTTMSEDEGNPTGGGPGGAGHLVGPPAPDGSPCRLGIVLPDLVDILNSSPAE